LGGKGRLAYTCAGMKDWKLGCGVKLVWGVAGTKGAAFGADGMKELAF